MLQLNPSAKKSFNVRLVRKGDAYGLEDCLTHDKPDPLVEFYDASWENQRGFGPRGQFVARYYARTLLDHGPYGLSLQGDIPAWSISAEQMSQVKQWLRRELGHFKRPNQHRSSRPTTA